MIELDITKPKNMRSIEAGEWAFLIIYLLPALIFHFCLTAQAAESPAEPVENIQIKLLETAFETASAIPEKPHIKDLCKTQAEIVDSCLQAERAELAEIYADKIKNWRRAECFARIAVFYMENGQKEKAFSLLEKSKEILHEQKEGWRKDLVVKLIESVEKSESGGGDQAKAQLETPDKAQKDKWIEALEDVIAKGDFDMTKNALERYVFLFGRYYEDKDFRITVERNIKNAWMKMPATIRFDLLTSLARASLDNKDISKAGRFIDESGLIIDSHNWHLEQYIPMTSQLMVLRFKTGLDKDFNSKIAEILNIFDTEKHKVLSIERAETLRPLAEACCKMGLDKTALVIYKKAVEEGVANPNSRPRAMDLAATCASMAVNNVEPDSKLWLRIKQIKQGLKEPW
jgi:tetratricopeptide (TPR) repeat protein